MVGVTEKIRAGGGLRKHRRAATPQSRLNHETRKGAWARPGERRPDGLMEAKAAFRRQADAAGNAGHVGRISKYSPAFSPARPRAAKGRDSTTAHRAARQTMARIQNPRKFPRPEFNGQDFPNSKSLLKDVMSRSLRMRYWMSCNWIFLSRSSEKSSTLKLAMTVP